MKILYLLNFSNYESALGFSQNALDKYYEEISKVSSPLSEQNNTTFTSQNYFNKLENGLVELNNNSIKNKENAMKVMEIVHTKVHKFTNLVQS